jgi:hypothetical protein
VSNPPIPPTAYTSTWSSGVFSWRVNNAGSGTDPRLHGSVNFASEVPAANTIAECGPAVIGGRAPLACRPASLVAFPEFKGYLGIDAAHFQSLLAAPDTTAAMMNAGQPPLGFTYVNGNYTLGAGTASPGTNQFGVMYVNGDLIVQGNHTFKGFIYVNGDLQIAAGAHLTVLGAMMVRDTYTHVGTGRTTLLYSREAAIRGLMPTRPWRVLSWIDAALAGN